MEQANNTIPNGMPPQNKSMNTMQRPQPGNIQQQLHAKIMSDLRNKMSLLPLGWQQTFDIGQRSQRVMQLVTMLRFLNPDTSACINIAENFEERTLMDSASKEEYLAKMDAKFTEITQKRQEQAIKQRHQMGMSMNMANMNNMQNPNMGGMNNMQNLNMSMNMNMANSGMGMPNAQMGGNGPQNQNFPAHLQRQMQPSPLPPQQQNNTLDPSALQNPQGPFQAPNMNQPNPPPQQNMNVGDQSQSGWQPSQQDIVNWARTMYAGMPDDRKDVVRTQWLSQLTDQQRIQVTSYPDDPLMRLLLMKAPQTLRRQKLGQAGQPQQTGSGMQMDNSMGTGGANTQQTPSSQPGASSFDFSSIMGQQQNAIKSAESGEQVVPASNNDSLNLAAQMNVSQAVDPQMLGNQNNQANSNQQAMQFMAMQRNRQNQELMQKNQIAQQQAMAQQAQTQSQLRGQPGGLNTPNALNGGQANSPAMNMNMLNRPLVPPVQKTPSTPQQNRLQGMPQTPVNGANQLAQHHQNMLTLNNQQMVQGAQGTSQQRMIMRLPQHVREKLQHMPPENVNQALATWAAKRSDQNQGMLNNNQQGQIGMPNINMGGAQMSNEQEMMNGMPSNMGNAVPGFNSQPPPTQQLNQQSQVYQSINLQQRMQQHQQSQLRQRAMDLRPFPKPVLGSLGISPPNFINEWGKLRQHITQNQSVLPPDSLNKFQAAQNQWFEAHPEELQAGMDALRQQMQNAQRNKAAQQQQIPVSRPSSAIQIPNGQAPPAQMVPPAVPMQQLPNPNAGSSMNQAQPRLPPPQPPTAQDVHMFREKVPGTQGMTDDEIRAIIMRRKIQTHQQSNQAMQESLRNAQMQHALIQANGGQAANAPQGNQQQPQRPPQQQKQQQGSNQQVSSQGQGQKRASSDDVVEIPDPNAPSMGAPQAPQMQSSQSMQQNQQQPMQPGLPKMPTKEQLEQMPHQQRMAIMHKMRQMDALRKAQSGVVNTQNQAQNAIPNAQLPNRQQSQAPAAGALQGATTVEEREKLRSFMQETAQANKKGPAVQLDSKGMELAQASLKKLWVPMQNIDRTFLTGLRLFGDQRVKDALRAKLILSQNAADHNGNIKDYLAITPAELRKLEAFIANYFQELKSIKDRQSNTNAKGQAQPQPNAGKAQQQPQPPPQEKQLPAKHQPAQQAPPLNRKASQQSQARKASAAAKAPPAPTENKTFDWGALSPHGVPKYDPARNELTADKLKFPPPKRRRTGGQQADSQSETPASQSGAPGAIVSPVVAGPKAPSPEQARKLQLKQEQSQEQVQAKFRCEDPLCDASITGFDTEELLKRHDESVHQPIADPLEFLLESAAIALGADKDGKPMPAKKEVKATTKPRGRPSAAAQSTFKRESQTPHIKQEGANPATPTSSGKAAERPSATSAGKKAIDGKAPVSAVDVPEKEKTLMETMADKIGFEMPATKAKKVPELSIESADDAWVDLLQNQLSDTNTYVDEWSHFSNVDDWGLRPEVESTPDLTPSDQASQSSRASDISQSERLRINFEWDAFGNGDAGVPEILMMQGLGLNETLGVGDDVTMAGADGAADEKKDGEAEKDVQWNWSNDLMNWDAMFGPNAGLEGDWVHTANAGMVF